MRIAQNRVKVQVPASSANLGPGYDCMGLALSLHDELIVEATTGSTEIEIEGYGADTLPRDDSNLIVKCLRHALDLAGAPQVGLRMHCTNRIPLSRGLGSSAAAIVAGIAAASGLVSDPTQLSRQRMLEIATDIEGHPDNIAPTIFGGVTLAISDEAEVRAVELSPLPLQLTLFVPDFTVDTKQARALLPDQIPHRDAADNSARAALLVLALQQDHSLLMTATEDFLHQAYREAAMPASYALVKWLRRRELPAVISGAGPAVMVFGAVGSDILSQAVQNGWDTQVLDIDTSGTTVETDF
ncbi:MAG: homoserine kinase [Varibaculum sp.]|nr:homoserine kinase [Varibaculum sp.]